MKQLLTALLLMLPSLLWGQGRERVIVPEGYLIVARSEYREALQPLVLWRVQDGYAVEQLYVDSADCDWIHQQLQTRYDQATQEKPFAKYILLVGDVEQIAPFTGRHKPSDIPSWHRTDLYYGEYTGDYLPESLVGRLPARDSAEVRRMVENLIGYERLQTADSGYLQRALLVAGKENQRPAPTATNGTVNYFKERIKEQHPEMDTACYYNPGSDTLMDEIAGRLRKGNGIVYYSGHGNNEGWVHPNLNNDIMDTLSLPGAALYIHNACNTANLQNDCMGNHLMRRESGGAIGYIGASNEALWNEDYYWSVGARTAFSLHPTHNPRQTGAIDHLLAAPGAGQRVTLGSLVHHGGLAVSQSGSPHDAFYWEIYTLLGDPALMPYIGIPQALPLTAPSTVENWATEITVHTLPFARVAASSDTLVIGVASADSNGLCTLPLVLTDKRLEHYTLKATLNNHTPTLREVATTPPEEARLAVVGQTFAFPTPLSEGDSLTLRLKLRNMGQDTAHQHKVSLSTADNVWIQPVEALGADSTCEVTFTLPYHFDTAQHWCASVALLDAQGAYSSVRIGHALPHPCPTIVSYQILEEDQPARILRPGAPYQMQLIVSNPLRNSCLLEVGDETFAIQPFHSDTLLVDITTPDLSQHHYAVAPSLTVTGEETFALPVDTSWWILNTAAEGFESGSLGAFPWDTACSIAPWHTDNSRYQQGDFSARSGSIGGRQTSRLKLAIEVNGDDSLTFWVRTSSEANYDRLNFYIDGQKQSYWSGEGGWRQARFAIRRGNHQLVWEYSKDDSGNDGNDCAWIDAIDLPLCRWEAPYGYFDDDSSAIASVARDVAKQRLTITPNPAHDQAEIALLGGLPGRILIYNPQGIVMDQLRVEPSAKNILQTIQYSTTHLRSGTYLVVFESKSTICSEKLIVIH